MYVSKWGQRRSSIGINYSRVRESIPFFVSTRLGRMMDCWILYLSVEIKINVWLAGYKKMLQNWQVIFTVMVGATKIFEGVQVERINTSNKRVTSLTTNEGEINCEYFINAAGLVATQFLFSFRFRYSQTVTWYSDTAFSRLARCAVKANRKRGSDRVGMFLWSFAYAKVRR